MPIFFLIFGIISVIFRKPIAKKAKAERERFMRVKFTEANTDEWETMILLSGIISIIWSIYKLFF